MVKKFVENGYAELVKIFSILLTAGGVIVAITLFIADRPTRAEVNKTIDDRLKPIEQQLQNVDKTTKDILKILIEKNTQP